MWALLLFNVITTALYTIVFEIGQNVYGNANAAFYNLGVSIVQFVVGSMVLVFCSFYDNHDCDSCCDQYGDSQMRRTTMTHDEGGLNVVVPPIAPPTVSITVTDTADNTSITELAREEERSVPPATCSSRTRPFLAKDWYFVRSVIVIAACCSSANFVWAVAGVQVKASLQAVMGLLLIPCAYFLTVVVLKRKMSVYCQVGALLVVLGAFVAALGGLVVTERSTSVRGDGSGDVYYGSTGSGELEEEAFMESHDVQDDDSTGGVAAVAAHASVFSIVMCYLMFEGMNLPYAYQYIVSEDLFDKGYGLWALEVYSGWLEVGFLLLLAPLQGSLLRFLGQTPEEFSFTAGFDCMLGSSCLESNNANANANANPNDGKMARWWPAFILFAAAIASVLNDLAYLLLTKYGSAVYMTVADGFSVSVVGVVTTFHFMGRYREDLSVFTIVSCVICTLGMMAWVKGEEDNHKQAVQQQQAQSRGGDTSKEDHVELFLQLQQLEEEDDDDDDEGDPSNQEDGAAASQTFIPSTSRLRSIVNGSSLRDMPQRFQSFKMSYYVPLPRFSNSNNHSDNQN